MTSPDLGYREHPPAPALRGLVDCYWSFSGRSGASDRVLPDGCADLLLDRTTATLRLVGTMTRALHLRRRGPQDLIAVRFRPGGAQALLAAPMGACVDLACPWEESASAPLLERVHGRSPEAVCAAFEALLLGRLPALSAPARRRAALAQRCLDSPHLRVSTLAQQLGLSRQHLGRQVLQATGVRPKLLARIGRLRRATRALEGSRAPDVSTALEADYCDQSHMINEFRALAGLTPGEYVRGLEPSSTPRVHAHAHDHVHG